MRASWVRAESMHLTLRFIGDTTPAQLALLRDALGRATTDAIAMKFNVRSLGAFPNLHKPRVLWAGLGGETDSLGVLQAKIESACRGVGCEPDNLAYHPHVTLARFRDARSATGLQDAIVPFRDWTGGDFEGRSVTLFASALFTSGSRREGARHSVLQEFPLKCS